MVLEQLWNILRANKLFKIKGLMALYFYSSYQSGSFRTAPLAALVAMEA